MVLLPKFYNHIALHGSSTSDSIFTMEECLFSINRAAETEGVKSHVWYLADALHNPYTK